jgi:hypothetical protein
LVHISILYYYFIIIIAKHITCYGIYPTLLVPIDIEAPSIGVEVGFDCIQNKEK